MFEVSIELPSIYHLVITIAMVVSFLLYSRAIERRLAALEACLSKDAEPEDKEPSTLKTPIQAPIV